MQQNQQSVEDAINEQMLETLGGIVLNNNTTAPVIVSCRDQLTVRVIPEGVLDQLLLTYDDSSLVSGFFWALIGGLVAVAVNVVSSWRLPNFGEWFLICAFFIGSSIFGYLNARFSRRKAKIIKQIMKQEDSKYEEQERNTK